MQRRELEELQFFSQNVHGLTEDKFEEMLAFMRERKIFAFAIQESWKKDHAAVANSGFTMVSNGNSTGPARGGVAIVMSPPAIQAWTAAGSKVLCYGTRIIAVKFQVRDSAKKLVNIVFASAYAPVCAARDQKRKTYYDDLQRCADDCGEDEILIIGTDINASMGVRVSEDAFIDSPRS